MINTSVYDQSIVENWHLNVRKCSLMMHTLHSLGWKTIAINLVYYYFYTCVFECEYEWISISIEIMFYTILAQLISTKTSTSIDRRNNCKHKHAQIHNARRKSALHLIHVDNFIFRICLHSSSRPMQCYRFWNILHYFGQMSHHFSI